MDRWFWVAALAVTALNGVALSYRVRPYVQADPSLAPSYGRLIRGAVFWLALPWVWMGMANTIAGLGASDYLRPLHGGPFVLVFYALVVGEWAVGTLWIFLLGGAATLSRHPGLLRGSRSPAAIQVTWLAAVAGGAIGLAMLCSR